MIYSNKQQKESIVKFTSVMYVLLPIYRARDVLTRRRFRRFHEIII